ncbi:hypothetical protein R3P38DRAFT_3240393 [Favolaschia claudopus]|uniref:Bacteriophage T5 Orf172 DNA-binding domain-containing protein n=1 Tax=Favolaschia claudopus TaxID=2862362 RepID=A0AAV9Z707_9AGAR
MRPARQHVGNPTRAAVTKEAPHRLGITVDYPTNSGRGVPHTEIVGLPTVSILAVWVPTVARSPPRHTHTPADKRTHPTRLSLDRVVPPSQRAHHTSIHPHTGAHNTDIRAYTGASSSLSPPRVVSNRSALATSAYTRLSRPIRTVHSMNTSSNTTRRLRRARLARLDRDLHDQSTLYNKIYRRGDVHSAIAKRPSPSDRPGVVYWLKMVHQSGLVEWKAGRTDNMQRRLRQWRRQCRGCRITVVDKVRTRYAKKLERCLHLYLKTSDLWKKPCACEACRVHHREKFEIGRLRGGIQKAVKVTRLLRDLVDS